MDDKNGGQQLSSAQKQQNTAAMLARQKVIETYRRQANAAAAPQTTTAPKRGFVAPLQTEAKKSSKRKGKAALKGAKLKSILRSSSAKSEGRTYTSSAAVPQVKADDWRKYHSAWQDYYQKYYGEYYQKAARDFVAKERLKYERESADKARKGEEAERAAIIASAAQDGTNGDEKGFKKKIQDKVAKRAKKMRKSRHFVPIIVGLSVLILGLLFQYNQVIIANAVAFMSPGGSEVNDIAAIDPTVSANIHENPTLMIPKLNVEVPVVFGAKNDVNSMAAAMSNGVAHFAIPGASAVPGEVGNFAVSGHSAGNIYQLSDYKFIFSGLTRMVENDLIYMDYNGTRYTYRVTGTNTVDPSDTASLRRIANDNAGKPMITLITCTPLGTSKYRLLVFGEQIHPVYDESEGSDVIPTVTPSDDDEAETMPKNDDSPLEQFWKWLTGQY